MNNYRRQRSEDKIDRGPKYPTFSNKDQIVDINDIQMAQSENADKGDDKRYNKGSTPNFERMLKKNQNLNRSTKEALEKDQSQSDIFNPNDKGQNIVPEDDISRFDLDMGMSDKSAPQAYDIEKKGKTHVPK